MSLLRKGRRGRRIGLVVAGSLFAFQALALIGATSASAAFASCQFTGGVLSVSLNAGDTVAFSTATVLTEDQITIDGVNTNTAGCTGAAGNATLANTTTIGVVGDTGDETVSIDLLIDWGVINWTIDLKDGTGDVVSFTDATDFVAGASGVDVNDDGDLDVTLAGVEELDVTGTADPDFISGGGGGATGGPTAIAMVVGALAGDDVVSGGAGDDVLGGGGGEDVIDYSSFTTAVTVDLGAVAPQATGGAGSDTLTGFEDIVGTSAGDTLTGDLNDNVITGGPGDDKMDGADGTDTADFSDSPAAVTVDLDAGTATGNGTDTLANFENVQGSEFDDVISGDDGPNGLFGGGGNDTLAGMGGGDDLAGEAGSDWVDYSWSDPVSLSLNCKGNAGAETTNLDTIETMENAILSTGDDSFFGNEFANRVQPNGGQNSLDGDGDLTVCGGLAVAPSGGDTLDYSVGYEAGVTVNMAGGATAGDSALGFENVIGTAFADNITGNESSNTIKAGKGNDNVKGGAGDDTIRLGAGNDMARGGSGDDDLFGGKGNDTLFGGGGDDLGKGGPGKDVCQGIEIARSCGTKKHPKRALGVAAKLI